MRAFRALRLDEEQQRPHGAQVAELAERVDGGARVVGIGVRPRLRVGLARRHLHGPRRQRDELRHRAPGVLRAERVGGRLAHELVGVVEQADERLLGAPAGVAQSREEKRRGGAHVGVVVREAGEQRLDGRLADLAEHRGGHLAAAPRVVADDCTSGSTAAGPDVEEQAPASSTVSSSASGSKSDGDQFRGELAQTLERDARLGGDDAAVDDLGGRVGHGCSSLSDAGAGADAGAAPRRH